MSTVNPKFDSSGRLRVSVDLSTGAQLFADGTAAAPSISFASDTDTGIYRAAANQLGFAVGGVAELTLNATNLSPGANDGLALGVSGTAYADLFLASGGVINWNAGNVTITQGASALTITSAAAATGSPTLLTVTGAAHTTLTASAEVIDVNFNLARTVQLAQGALTTQRAFVIQAPTYGFATGSSTVTTAVTSVITAAPTAGTNAVFTNTYVQQLGGAVTIGATASGMQYGVTDYPAHTVTVTGSTQVTSACGFAMERIGILTVTDGSAVTVDAAASLYIAGAVAQAGSVTITNKYSLWVDAGNVRFDGNLSVGSTDASLALSVGGNGVIQVTDGTYQTRLSAASGCSVGSISNHDFFLFTNGSSAQVTLTTSGNLVVGASAAGTTAAKVLALSNSATAPTNSADLVQLYAYDISAGNASLGIFTETAVATDVAISSTHSLTVKVNGTAYKIPLVAV